MRKLSTFFLIAGTLIAFGFATGCRTGSGFASRKTQTAAPAETPSSRLTGTQVADIQVSLCRTLEQQGSLQRARDGYRKILSSDSKNATAAWRLAVVSDRLGEMDQSEPLYRQAIDADPTNVDLLADYGYSLYLKRRWAEAESTLTKAAALDPKNPRVKTNLGLLLAQTERADEALAAFRSAGCKEAEAQSNLGLILAMNGRDDQARGAFEKSLALRGEGKAARQGLTALQARAKASRSMPGATPSESHPDAPKVIPDNHEEPESQEPAVRSQNTFSSAEEHESLGRAKIGTGHLEDLDD